MDIGTILICIGTGLLLIVGVVAVLGGIRWCLEKAVSWMWDKADSGVPYFDWPEIIGYSLIVVALFSITVLVGCLLAFNLGWIADCPWCEVKP